MLIEGVKLYSGKRPLTNVIQLSKGTIAASKASGERCYCHDAVIPTGEWVAPTNAELSQLSLGDSLPNTHATVSIFSIPDELLQMFWTFGQLSTQADFDQCFSTREGGSALVDLLAFLQPFAKTKITKYGFGMNLPDLPTVTMTGNCFEGLHIDQQAWDEGTSRLMLNIGREIRYFLYINLELTNLQNQIANSDNKLSGKTRLGREFMRAFPDYPVVRLRIRPGEGYIAPTNRIIHDGSTVGAGSADIIFTTVNEFERSLLQGNYGKRI